MSGEFVGGGRWSSSVGISERVIPVGLDSKLTSYYEREGNEVYFRIKRNTQLRKLMIAYCDQQSLDPKSIVFLFDGRRIHAEQTPDQLGMEDCDEVDAMLHQTGGGGFGDI
ncbi:hypothetical protein ACSBR1_031158 [Camellia fascicularis]